MLSCSPSETLSQSSTKHPYVQEIFEANAAAEGAKFTLIPFRADDDARKRGSGVLGGETVTLLHAHVKRQLSDNSNDDGNAKVTAVGFLP